MIPASEAAAAAVAARIAGEGAVESAGGAGTRGGCAGEGCAGERCAGEGDRPLMSEQAGVHYRPALNASHPS